MGASDCDSETGVNSCNGVSPTKKKHGGKCCKLLAKRWMLPYMPKSSMQTLAVVCMLLTLGTIVIPRGTDSVDGLLVGVIKFRQLGSTQTETFIEHPSEPSEDVADGRRCRPLNKGGRPDPVTIEGRNANYTMGRRKETGQWVVPARKDGLMSIMTPVFPENRTLSLLRNQLLSANKFLDVATFHEWIFITPAAKVAYLADFLEEQVSQLPCLQAKKMRVVADEQCVPELELKRLKQISKVRAKAISGWTKQQLVKLGCSQTISTPYYLITDADMFFMRDLQALDLTEQRECNVTSTVCDLPRKISFRARNEMQPPLTIGAQQMWEHGSAKTLHMPMAKGAVWHMGVTPQVMSRTVLDKMLDRLETLGESNESWGTYLLRLHVEKMNSKDPAERGTPAWTEFDLYWLFAVNAGLWDEYHIHSTLQKYSANLWQWKDYKKWKPCAAGDEGEQRTGYWAVVQSSLGMTGEEVWEHLEPCMQHEDSVADI